MRITFKWSGYCIICTTMIVLLTSGQTYLTVMRPTPLRMGLAILVWGTLPFFAAIVPRTLIVSKKALILKRMAGEVVIPLTHIQVVESWGKRNVITPVKWGSSGFFGYTGFWDTGIGWVRMYATENKKYLFVKTDKKKYLIGCRIPEEVIRYIEDVKR